MRGLEVEVGSIHGRVLVQEAAIVPHAAAGEGSSYNAAMALPPEVCIRGAGIVGRTLALLLARERVRVALVAPRRPRRTDRTCAPMRSTPPRRTLLESLRAWPDAAHATPVREMLVHGDEGGRVQFSAARQKVDALAWIVDVPALEQQLSRRGALPAPIEVVAAPRARRR